MKKLFSLLIAFSAFINAFSQTITHGPFISAVTENSAKSYLRTNTSTAFDFVISLDSTSFSSPITYYDFTNAAKDTSAIISISGLLPDTKYYYKVIINGLQASAVQSFRTFPLPNSVSNFTFAFGSCEGFSGSVIHEPIFAQVINSSPRFFLECGDWGYPDVTDNFPFDTNFFSIYYTKIQESYHLKYSPHGDIFNLMKTTPIDYVYDDHDYMQDNSARDFTPNYSSSPGVLIDVPNPPGARENSIRAYTEYFPAYPMVDTSEGIFHSIRYGNVEIFMCDDRSARSPSLEGFVPDTANAGLLMYDPPAGHSMLGQIQMNWLVNGLKTSSAKWKFVMTGVAFNKGYQSYLDFALTPFIQNTVFTSPFGSGNGKNFAAGIVDTWIGFPEDQNRLLSLCSQDSIGNLIFLTSDSHTAALDDGGNSGFPELMSGNLNQTNSKLAHLTDSLGMNVWNGGGEGIGNNNFSFTFGKIDVFGNDSVRLSIIDTLGSTIASIIVHDGVCTAPSGVSETNKKSKNSFPLIIYPNPARDFIRLKINDTDLLNKKGIIEIYDFAGKRVISKSLTSQKEIQVNLGDISQGLYFCVVTTEKGKFTAKFSKGN